jgi:protein N-terminal amidase
MAWLTREEARSYSRTPREPDMETLSYWVSRLEPLIRAEGEEEIIVVFANRSGTEGEAVYAGTSAVLGIQDGEVKVYGILGRGERELLVVDTSKRPAAHLISDPNARDKARAKPTQDCSGDLLDVRSSMSSAITVESDDSIRTVDSGLSVSTAPTSANPDAIVSPPIDNCCLTPTSPVDSPFPQAYFGSLESPSNTSVPEILPPDNFQQTFTPSPRPDIFRRPESPKSRNASRSRGPAPVEFPLLESDFVPVPVPETPPSHSEARIPEAPEVPEALKARPSRADFVVNRPTQSASADPSEQESSFTKNTLGPRSRHVSPRPQSTIW